MAKFCVSQSIRAAGEGALTCDVMMSFHKFTVDLNKFILFRLPLDVATTLTC
jgi:hypothetical protein